MPRLHPDLIFRNNLEDGEPIVAAMVRGSDKILRFDLPQWQLLELFDGVRTYEEIAETYAAKYGVLYAVPDLREFVARLEDTGIWHSHSIGSGHAGHQHGRNKASRWADISHIQFSAWDPDRYFDRIYPRLRWIYTQWFTCLTLLAFTFVFWIWVTNWSQITADNLAYFNFTNKSGSDLGEFWTLLLFVGFVHETAHGLTCKHYGGQVHKMGFHLVYLMPAFFVDVTEAWVYASRWQRLAIIIAGLWSELILAAIASFVWWGTPSGSDVHDIAYKMILLNGIFVIVVNLNPLVKLDGYYAFSEIVGYADIKEKATAYLSSLVRSRIFRLPVTTEYVPKRRRLAYLCYAVLSGVYSYGLLVAALLFSYRIFSRFTPMWAFLPSLLLGLVVFRSRIRLLFRFCRTVYLDKRDRLRDLLARGWGTGFGMLLLLVLFLPIWHETVSARFLLEPIRTETVRTLVPGRVAAVLVREGEQLRGGDPLLRMTNLHLESEHDAAESAFQTTGLERARTLLAHGSLADVQQRHLQARTEQSIANDEVGQLIAHAPFDGTVLTPRMRDLLGTFLPAGSPIAEIADTTDMRARLYILDYAIAHVAPGAKVSLLLDGTYVSLRSRISSIEPETHPLPDALEPVKKMETGASLQYYVANAVLGNDGRLRSGMSGTAKILVARRSLAGLAWRNAEEFVQRKVW